MFLSDGCARARGRRARKIAARVRGRLWVDISGESPCGMNIAELKLGKEDPEMGTGTVLLLRLKTTGNLIRSRRTLSFLAMSTVRGSFGGVGGDSVASPPACGLVLVEPSLSGAHGSLDSRCALGAGLLRSI